SRATIGSKEIACPAPDDAQECRVELRRRKRFRKLEKQRHAVKPRVRSGRPFIADAFAHLLGQAQQPARRGIGRHRVDRGGDRVVPAKVQETAEVPDRAAAFVGKIRPFRSVRLRWRVRGFKRRASF
ncbi:MAG TPA: hypothetical protein DEH78_02935, partial [Solibacterales bacterium]|nr:hypothetical protein [Bryobacterales bacterium]